MPVINNLIPNNALEMKNQAPSQFKRLHSERK